MWRLTDRIVRSGLVIAWRLATSPTRPSPFLAKATTEGVVRPPSALGMTVGSPPSRTATTELVVPRSMPTALGMCFLAGFSWGGVRSVRTGPHHDSGPAKASHREVECPVDNFVTVVGKALGDVGGVHARAEQEA